MALASSLSPLKKLLDQQERISIGQRWPARVGGRYTYIRVLPVRNWDGLFPQAAKAIRRRSAKDGVTYTNETSRDDTFVEASLPILAHSSLIEKRWQGRRGVKATMIEEQAGTGTSKARILIADDQQDLLYALRLLLKGQGYETEAVTSPAELLRAVAASEFDLILMDLNYARDTTSGDEGLDLLNRLKGKEDTPPIVVMTGWATVGLAVAAMQYGVADFVEKPWTNARLLEILSKQIGLGRERRAARRRAAQDVADARAIQQRLLPKSIPQLPGYEVAGAWQPAQSVGGDYYDVLAFDGHTLGLCIADVSGKGMPAALLMSNLQAAVQGLASPALAPDRLCERLNSLVYHNTGSDRFITFFYAQLDGPARLLCYCNAGHNAPVVLHRDGSHERLDAGGGVLGIFPSQDFSAGIAQLAAGDRVVFFTDGVTEACNADGEQFGESRLLKLLAKNLELNAADLQARILSAVSEFSRGDWSDDATLLVLAVGNG
jgi:sigma-B regulation protein RsbU (phosphoserine phosphatase)